MEEEIEALTLAKKGNVKEIVDFFGAKVERGIAHICMEYMEGEKKSRSLTVYKSIYLTV